MEKQTCKKGIFLSREVSPATIPISQRRKRGQEEDEFQEKRKQKPELLGPSLCEVNCFASRNSHILACLLFFGEELFCLNNQKHRNVFTDRKVLA